MAAGTKERARKGTSALGGAGATERRLFLIDGPSLVYRAFFALPESIATSTGVPTNAIFGFASMLVKIVTEYGVQPTVVAWDAGTSGRSELFADYKASRRSRPDLLKQQWPSMAPLVEAFGYTNVTIDGYEADDVIASLAERALRADPPVPVMIVTGDRDVFQLIDEDGLVKVMATSRGITETKIYDRRAVIDRYGIGPELIPDFYGLKGDTSDNIPGIPGIGDKTASELLQSFGTLEEVLANVEQVKGAKRKQNLIEHAEDARMSRELATVRRDLDVDLDVALAAEREPDRSRLRDFFREYELRDPLRRLEEALGDPDVAAPASATEVTLTASLRAGAPADVAALGSARRRGLRRRRGDRAARGRAVRRGRALALRGERGRRCDRGRLRRARGSGRGLRGAPGRGARREGASHRAGAARPRHPARRLPARSRAARLPAGGALRGARARQRPRGSARGARRDAGGAGRLAARADRRARASRP